MFAGLKIQGVVALPGSSEYELSMSRVYNKQSVAEHHPLAIVVVNGTRDIVQTILFCKVHKLVFSILGGGVNPSGASISGKVVLDLRRLKFVHVDKERNVAIVGAGMTFRELDYELEGQGRCVPGPLFCQIGVAGAFLGGGWGFLSKMYGMLCDQVEELDVVTSDGKLRTVSAKADDSELFWALTRGGGAGTLGVVTSITFVTSPVPKVCYHGHIEFPLRCWQPMTEALIRLKPKWPKEFILYPVIETIDFRLVLKCLVFCATGEEGAEEFVEEFLAEAGCGLPVIEDPTLHGPLDTHIINRASEKTYFEAQAAMEKSFIVHSHVFQKAKFVDKLSVTLMQLVLMRIQKMENCKVALQNYFYDNQYLLLVTAHWRHESNPLDGAVHTLLEEVTAGLESDYGAAPNFAPKNTSLLELFSKRDAVRLVRIKKRYDPDNMFSRHNLKF